MSVLKNIMKFLGIAGKTAKDSLDKSMDVIDDALESEYITGSIDKAKEFTGKAAEKAGEIYEKSKHAAEEMIGDDTLQNMKDKASEIGKRNNRNCIRGHSERKRYS